MVTVDYAALSATTLILGLAVAQPVTDAAAAFADDIISLLEVPNQSNENGGGTGGSNGGGGSGGSNGSGSSNGGGSSNGKGGGNGNGGGNDCGRNGDGNGCDGSSNNNGRWNK